MGRMPAPFRSMRRHLKRINYYSASSGSSPWKRAADWWLLLSLPLAIAATFLVDAHVHRESATALITIRVGQERLNAPIVGWIEREQDEPWAIGVPLGRGTIFTTRHSSGWPLATTEQDGPTTVKYTDFQGNCTILEAPLPESWHPTEAAIAQALEAERMAGVASAWMDGTTRTTSHTARFLAQAAINWVTLFVLGLAAMGICRLIVAWIRIQRHRLVVRRLGRGVCPGCRYDLSGM